MSSGTLAPPGKYNRPRAFFGPPKSTTQTTNQSVQPFSHNSRQIVPIHCVSKNVPPLVCYDTRERILIFFGRNVIDEVSNQKTPYCATSNNLCFCTTWQNGETRKSHFSLKCRISALPEFKQSLYGFFNQCVQLRAIGGMVREKGLFENATAVGLCYTHNACAPMRCLPEIKNIVICDVFDNI